jgi:hypothetical protein
LLRGYFGMGTSSVSCIDVFISLGLMVREKRNCFHFATIELSPS